MELTLKTVRNGYIAEHCGETYVFSTPEQLTEWMNREYPAKDETTIYNVVITGLNPNRMIPLIKVVRELTGLGLREAKDAVDRVRAGQAVTIAFRVGEELAKDFRNRLSMADGITELRVA